MPDFTIFVRFHGLFAVNMTVLRLLLLVCGFLSSFVVSGQEERKLQFGLCATGNIKYQFLSTGSRNYMLFGQAGMGAALKVAGEHPKALQFLAKATLCRENTGYRQVSGVRYFIENISFVFNPEILIPTRNDRWQLTAGIGLDWTLSTNLALYTSEAYYQSGDLDEAYNTIRDAQRKLIPFVSAGVLYRLKGHLYAQAFLRQHLRDSYPEGTIVTFGKGRDNLEVELGHQPTCLGIGLFYFF